jgi:paraquat-inducible protein A
MPTCLVTTHLHARGNLRQKTKIYRIVEMVGRWSMIDVFMISILTAILRIGASPRCIPAQVLCRSAPW